jgi:hypothetical protein
MCCTDCRGDDIICMEDLLRLEYRTGGESFGLSQEFMV